MDTLGCPFCTPLSEHVVLVNDLCFARWDNYPVNEGHMLIIPHRHFADYFDASEEEKKALWGLVDQAKLLLDNQLSPQGYNIGVNVGEVAGQTVSHLHIHLIPRYAGDMPDPKGGVRGVIPEKQKY